MMTRICTGWHPEGWDEYAKNFARTFTQHWPEDVEIVAYIEEPDALSARIEQMPLWVCKGVGEFISKHKDSPVYCGKVPQRCWKKKEIDNGYSFRTDAVRFCKQLFIPEDAAIDMENGDILAWFDADVVTYRDVPDNFIDGLLGESHLCYLGREAKGKHPDIGFWALRLNTETRGFLYALADAYRSETLFQWDEWHSAYVFNRCLAVIGDGCILKDLTPGEHKSDHVWFDCKLGDYTDHLKGAARKAQGRSWQRDSA